MYEDKRAEIMILGCGSSNLGEQLYKREFQFITNIDFSTIIINHMQEKHK